MPRRKSPTFTEVELEFMHVIWENGEVSTENVMTILARDGRVLSDGSVRKILTILQEKGHLTRRRQGKRFLYRPAMSREDAWIFMVKDLLARAFHGSPKQFFISFLKAEPLSKNDIREIRRIIDEHERIIASA